MLFYISSTIIALVVSLVIQYSFSNKINLQLLIIIILMILGEIGIIFIHLYQRNILSIRSFIPYILLPIFYTLSFLASMKIAEILVCSKHSCEIEAIGILFLFPIIGVAISIFITIIFKMFFYGSRSYT